MLQLAQTEVFAQGAFYDLTYCNYGNPRYDVHRQFAFFRHTEREVVLVVANFDAEAKISAINIPEDAWHFVGVKAGGNYMVTDLKTGQKWERSIDLNQPFEVEVEGYDATLLSITL